MEWSQVLRMTWGDLQRRIHGYRIRDDRAWQKARAIFTMIHNRGVRKGQQKKPEQLMPLAIDRAHRPRWTEENKRKIKEAQKRWKFKEPKDGSRKENRSLDKRQDKP